MISLAEVGSRMGDSLITLGCAELLFLLVRSKNILIAVKRENQRSTSEKLEIKQGLCRALWLEGLVFVPASSVLAILVIKAFLTKAGLPAWIGNQQSFDGLLGIASYGFPFATLRAVVTRIALGTLKEFAAIATEAHGDVKPPQEDRAANA